MYDVCIIVAGTQCNIHIDCQQLIDFILFFCILVFGFRTSVAHMDSLDVVDVGFTQMLSLAVKHDIDDIFDVYGLKPWKPFKPDWSFICLP